MRFSIYIDQVFMVKHDLNFQEASLMYLAHQAAGWAKFSAGGWYWVSFSSIKKELPAILKTDRIIRTARAGLENKNLIEQKVVGRKNLFRLTELGREWGKLEGQITPNKIVTSTAATPNKIVTSTPNKNVTQSDNKLSDNNLKDNNKHKSARKHVLDFSPWHNLGQIEQQVLDDLITTRKANRAPLTQTAINRAAKQLELAMQSLGLSVNDCLAEWVEAGWRGFKAEWLANRYQQHKNQLQSMAADNDVSWADGLYIEPPKPDELDKKGEVKFK